MRRLGKFTVLDETPIHNAKRHCTMLKCRCDCGRELYVNKYTLESGKSISCRKCFGKTLLGSKNPNYRGYKSIPSSIFTRAKRRAKTSGMTWNLTLKFLHYLLSKQKQKCAITQLPISFSDKTASLDRIDSTEGYVPHNVQWVHKDVNIMKNGYELGYFAFICGKVIESNSDILEKSKFIYGKH